MVASGFRIREIDGLRGIAILTVVIYHLLVLPLPLFFSRMGMWEGLKLLAYGVDLFFVISGFLVGTILLRIENLSGIKAFYIRRIVRIWPLYYLLLFLVYSVLPEKSLFAKAPYWSFIFFIFNFWESVGIKIHLALGPLWSVAIEEQFYLLGPILFSILNRKQISYILLVCLLLSPLLRLVLLYNTDLDLWRFTPARIDGICAGLLLSIFLSSKVNISFVSKHSLVFKSLMFLLLILLVPSKIMLSDYVWTSFGHSLVVLAFLSVLLVVQIQNSLGLRIRLLNLSFLRYLGLRCYSIYLFHIFFNYIAITISNKLYVDLIVELTLTLLFAHFSWRYIESPFINFGQKFPYEENNKLNYTNA